MRYLILCTLVLSAASWTAAQDGEDWPQWRGKDRNGVWREDGIVTELPDELTPRWRVPLGSGYCGPTIAKGRVYVMDLVREPEDRERVHCFAWDTGKKLWSHEYACSYTSVKYPAGPRCSVLVHDGLAYSLGSTGRLFCFDAATGDVKWEHDLDATYRIRMPIWGIAAAPVIEGDLLIVPVCGETSYLVAFHRKTGKEVWKAHPDGGNYSAPIVIDHAGRRVLVVWAEKRILGVAPESGALLWHHDFKPKRMPLGVATPVLNDGKLLFSGFFDGTLVLELDPKKLAVKQLWHRRGQNEVKTDALHSIIATPVVKDGHVYGVDGYGQMRCLKLADGERVWEDLTVVPKARWATAHFVEHGEKTWIFNERGELLITELSPKGVTILDRAPLIKPTLAQLNRRGGVVWTHPGFAYRHVFIRNDEEMLCVDLSAPTR